MKYMQACCSLALFGWASFAILTDKVPAGDNGSSKTRSVASVMNWATEEFGTLQAGVGFAAFGVLLALFFVMRRDA